MKIMQKIYEADNLNKSIGFNELLGKELTWKIENIDYFENYFNLEEAILINLNHIDLIKWFENYLYINNYEKIWCPINGKKFENNYEWFKNWDYFGNWMINYIYTKGKMNNDFVRL